MKYLRRFGQFINESSRLTRLGLIRLSEEQEEALSDCVSGTWEFDPNTGLVNVDGNFDASYSYSRKFNGIRFGTVSGDFYCSRAEVTSLDGAPQWVGGNFFCSHNQLTNLIGAPHRVEGGFYCADNGLTSLEGAPVYVGGSFFCNSNKLTSLKGAPEWVGGSFDCGWNHLTSLEGSPQEVRGSFDCGVNRLTSLEGAPHRVVGEFNCSPNDKLKSLVGIPKLRHVKVPMELWGQINQMKEAAKKLELEE